jgi:gliding motility-associated-like protein
MPRIVVLHIALYLLSLAAKAQVQLTPVLVGSIGANYTFSGGTISCSAGEAAIITISNSTNILTQGFHQPLNLTSVFTINTKVYNATCNGSNDGAVKVAVDGGIAPYVYEYEYEIDPLLGFVPYIVLSDSTDTLNNLKPGRYIVRISDFYNRVVEDTFSIKIQYEGDCEIKIYSGITPNGDGVNDIWIIDGIQFYEENSVAIYSRWGDLVWQKTGYNNKDIAWDGTWSFTGEKLPSGTYFYLITIPNKQFKGWVELTR